MIVCIAVLFFVQDSMYTMPLCCTHALSRGRDRSQPIHPDLTLKPLQKYSEFRGKAKYVFPSLLGLFSLRNLLLMKTKRPSFSVFHLFFS